MMITLFKRKPSTVQYLDRYKYFLCKGKFVYNKNLNIVYLDDSQTKDRVKDYLEKGYDNYVINRSLLKRLFLSLIRKKNKFKGAENNFVSNIFNGQVILPSVNGSNTKIFDFNKMEVLTIFYDESKLKLKLKTYEDFSPFFNIPQIKQYNRHDNFIVEELIEYIPPEEWGKIECENVMRELVDSESKLKNHLLKSNLYTEIDFNSFVKVDSCLLNLVTKYIDSKILSESILYFYQHGDIWSSNILVSKTGKIFIIDWENSNNYSFFYDIHYFMLNEVLTKANYYYLDSYLDGKYDLQINRNFNCYANYSYEKKDYLYYTLLLQINYKWTNLNKFSTIKMYFKIYKIIKYIENY